MGGSVLWEEYVPETWLEAASRLANEPEGGARCALCFRLQLEAAARRASAMKIPLLCTTLTISPHKNAELINSIGAECASQYGVAWLARVFRKKNGFVRSVALSKEYGLYRQSYCGCLYSMTRGGNNHGTAARGEASPVAP
jgi:predicted adenine nucleotide alpha hydrolase (AANH) superfamily ATPase